MAKMRILCITGAWCLRHPQPAWTHLIPALREEFPEADPEVCLEEMHFLWPWQFRRMRKFCDQTVDTYDKGGKILIVGHSMGGVMGYEIAQRLRHTRVVGVATICSPHTFLWSVFPKRIGICAHKRSKDIPVVSFEASIDPLVWWGAEHPDAHYHGRILSDHRFALQYLPSVAHTIARLIRASFKSHTYECA